MNSEDNSSAAYWARPNNQDRLVHALRERLGYGEAGARYIATRAAGWRPALGAALAAWLAQTPIDPGLSVGDYSLEDLMRNFDFNIPNSLSVLQWLDRDPAAAIADLTDLARERALGGYAVIAPAAPEGDPA